jgi:hypothetical protein
LALFEKNFARFEKFYRTGFLKSEDYLLRYSLEEIEVENIADPKKGILGLF